ncbi:MAG: hypothetical protein IKR28_11450 [Selenomonadaceae bacterium]|nr:hypothetical protein [Selenomonadaceae bacterium]
MKTFAALESCCSLSFDRSGPFFHLWTPECHPLIFANESQFKAGMSILAIASKLVPQVRILTFQLMTNHIHLTIAGFEDDIRNLFYLFRRYLTNYFKANGLVVDLLNFVPQIRAIESIQDLRNVITYNNRNGYVVSPDYTPFTYPWGANAYYYNTIAKERFLESREKLHRRERRELIRTHDSDGLEPIVTVNGFACPMSFCHIPLGESIFRCASHYFREVSRNMESQKEIAAEIGERIFYTDDELFSIVLTLSKQKYGQLKPSLLPVSAKKDLAILLHNDYNAGNRQIQRMIKLDISVVNALFPERF